MQHNLRNLRLRVVEYDALDNMFNRTGIIELDALGNMIGDGECRHLLATRLLDSGGPLADPGLAGIRAGDLAGSLAGGAGGGCHGCCCSGERVISSFVSM